MLPHNLENYMESKNLSLLNERIAFLDYIRVIACLLVMVIHTCSRFLIREWAWEYCTPNVLLTSFGAFLLFTCIQKAPRWITSLAKLSFGMYLMHVFFLRFIAEWIIGGDVAHPLLPVWLAIPVIGLLTFLCCAVVTKLISLIPGSKYVIG